MKASNYIKIGLVISIIFHIGFFVLGGYVMNNITKELNEHTNNVAQDEGDITYVDIGIAEPESKAAPEVATPVESEVVVSKQTLENAKIPETVKGTTENIEPEPVKKTMPKHKLRTYKDAGIKIKEIDKNNLVLNFNNVKSSADFMPTYKHKENPVYDTSLIPKGEVVSIVIEYMIDDKGKVIQAYPIVSASESGLGLSPEVCEDLDTACIQALEKYKIIPPKDMSVNMPHNERFFLTSNGIVSHVDY